MAFYWARFGSGAPSTSSGLNPTFISFVNNAGQTLAPPSITELFTGTGLYGFSYTPTVPIAFTLDGATTGLQNSVRYVAGSLNPQDDLTTALANLGTTMLSGITFIVGQNFSLTTQVTNLSTQVSNLGLSSLVGYSNLSVSIAAIATSIGSTASSYGDDVTDPTTVFGFLKRSQEFWEGNEIYFKNTGILDFFARGSTTTLLREKTISDITTQTSKT